MSVRADCLALPPFVYPAIYRHQCMHGWQLHGGWNGVLPPSLLLAGSIGSGGQDALRLLCCGGASGGMPEKPRFGSVEPSHFAS